MIDAVMFDILYKFSLSPLQDTKNNAFAGIADCMTAANFHLIIHSKRNSKGMMERSNILSFFIRKPSNKSLFLTF